jgi:protein phosphatase
LITQILGGGLASDTLHLLDLTNGEDNCKWIVLPTTGPTPGKRYGHTMCYCKPYLILYGGNLGNSLTNDSWIINVEDGILEWKKLQPTGDMPISRMYHASSVCKYGKAAGMIIVHGGRGENGGALNDTWGLRKHRNGTWDWVKAPYFSSYTPLKRFQHSMVFYNNFMIIIGGRSDNDLKSIPIEVYDTETSDWNELPSFNKFRHSSWIVNNFLFTHGGFDYSSPMYSKNDLVMIDVLKLLNTNQSISKKLEKSSVNETSTKVKQEIEIADTSSSVNNTNSNNSSKNVTPKISPTNASINKNNTILSSNQNYSNIEQQFNLTNKIQNINEDKNKKSNNANSKKNAIIDRPIIKKEGEISILSSTKNEDKIVIKKVILDEKGKYRFSNEVQEEPLYEKFLNVLLNPIEWIRKPDTPMDKFHFTADEVKSLTRDCIKVVASQPMVLRINTPVKVFGDVHGQYIDLMTFFARWGEPKEGTNGDIHVIDYLFLGDYVDRGNMSLETMCLLMALKVKYPDRFHLLRGNHEDKLINCGFGFLDECQIRLEEDPYLDDSVFSIINEFFEYLPLAAIIEDQILCLHGGIGKNVQRISDIEKIERPLEVIHEAITRSQQIVMDILWSDPTDNDEEMGIQPNVQRDSNNYGNIVKFGPDIVKKFLQNNNLSYIIRAHECVLDGFERFAGGALITLFSATDYCRRHNNAGAMLVIKSNFEMVPHLIYPPDGGNKHWIDDEDTYKIRPPTPPRVRYEKSG